MTQQSHRRYTCIDLFAGAGGLSSGLQSAGFEIVLASDIDPVFGRTYCRNHPNTVFVDEDIRSLSGAKIMSHLGLRAGTLDLLAGGPPCQGFSINAPIRSLDDQRNHLFRDFMRIAELLKPKCILIENVPGIISLGRGTVVEAIYIALHSIGYSAQHRILFAAHYGVPQMRYRTILLATRLNTRIRFPQPEYDANGVSNFTGARELCLKPAPLFEGFLKCKTTVWDAISDLPEIAAGQVDQPMKYVSPPLTAYQKRLRRGARRLYNHTASRIAPINLLRLKHIPQGGSWRDIPQDLLPDGLKRARRSDHTKRYGRLDPNGLSSTILTKCDPHWGSFFHPHQDRVLSVREAARIQSFSDRFVFEGSRTEQYAQVGNAVPPLLAEAIGREIRTMIRGCGTR